MKLTYQGIQNKKEWEDHGVILPTYDLEAVQHETDAHPRWLHVGAGNIFRAFPCALQQDLLNRNLSHHGIIVAEGFDYEIVEAIYKPHDNLGLLVTLKADGSMDKTVISSVTEALAINPENTHDYGRLRTIFRHEGLQMVSFTITEKGYSVKDGAGMLHPIVVEDIQKPLEEAQSTMGKLVYFLHERFEANGAPLALVSMDNCAHNGDRLKEAVLTLAKGYCEHGAVRQEFIDYLSNPQLVSYPWSMIDKITPRPDASVKQNLLDMGFADAEPRVTSRGTYISSFVNAEEAQYLVIEDRFPNGRPPLEEAGVMFTDRETVNKVEKMKVCTCLNPLHTALAIFGCLLSFDTIYQEMQDEDLRRLVEIIGYEEGLPVVVNPGIIDPKAFIEEVLTIRFPNPFMPDTPQRIATDTSQKLAIRFGETIKAYEGRDDLDTQDLTLIPLVLAAWIRYLMGVNDAGETFVLSDDPLMASLQDAVKNLELGTPSSIDASVQTLLSREDIFGVDLEKVGLKETVITYLEDMLAGPGSVRATLAHALNERRK